MTQQRGKAEEYFYVGKVKVIKNPVEADHRALSKEFIKYLLLSGFYQESKDEPYFRATYDRNDNEYIWRSDAATHAMIEPYINRKFNTTTNRKRNRQGL